MNKEDFVFYIDLVMDVYETSNPIKIVELIKEEFGFSLSIHQVSDYLDINKHEDYEKESLKVYHQYY